MSTPGRPRPIEYASASAQVREVFDDIKATRGVADVNNFWNTALAQKAGMTDQMFTELMAFVGMANQTNRFADGFRLPIDEAFDR